MKKRLAMEIMPRGDFVYSTDDWPAEVFERGGLDFSVVAHFKVKDLDGREYLLNPKYVIRCWLEDS